LAHFFAAAALFRSRSSGANRRLTSSAEKASGSKSSPSRARLKTYGFCFLRDPFIGIPREPFYLWPLSTPFRPGSEHHTMPPRACSAAAREFCSMSSRMAIGWPCVTVTRKTTWRSGSSTRETASRIKFRDRSKPLCSIEVRGTNGTDFKAGLDGNLALEHTPGTEPRRPNPDGRQHELVLRLPVAGRLGLWAKTNSTSYFKDYVVTPLK
jgi:hypothetical protein